MQISFQIFDFMLRNFVLFFWDFNWSSHRKEDLQMLLKMLEMMENVRGSDQF